MFERLLDKLNADRAALEAVIVVFFCDGNNYNRLVDAIVKDRLDLLIFILVEE